MVDTGYRVRLSKVLLVLFMSAAMIMGTIPCDLFVVTANAEIAEKTITGLMIGGIRFCPDEPKDENAYWSGDYVYYGKYSDNGSDYYPVKYRVLSAIDSYLLLDCDEILTYQAFDSSDKSNQWEESSIRAWLQGDSFYRNESVFTAAERNGIKTSPYEGGEGYGGTPGNYNSVKLGEYDPIFLLDVRQAYSNIFGYYEYFVSSNTRIKKKHGSNFSSDWWLRSDCVDKLPDEKVGQDRPTAAVVLYNGLLSYCSVNDVDLHGVSPAFYVDMDRIVFSSLLAGQDSSQGSEYKLTMLDESLDVSPGKAEVSGNTLTIPYSEVKGDPTQLSVVITGGSESDGHNGVWSSGEWLECYGRLNISGEIGEEGKGTFTLPEGYSVSDNKVFYQGYGVDIYLLGEKVNGGESTDYAGSPKQVSIIHREPQTISVSEDSVTLTVGDTYVNEVTGAKTAVSYSSSAPEVATVSENGMVKAVGKGEAIITVTAKETDEWFSAQASFKVTVKEPEPEPVKEKETQTIAFTRDSITLKTGDTFRSELTGAKTSVTYKSSNEGVATVSENGMVRAVGKGEALITAAAEETNDYKSAQASFKVTVEEPEPEPEPEKETQIIAFTRDSITLKTGDTFMSELTGAKTPVTYKSSNEEVATVSENGLVTAIGEGTAAITATAAQTEDYLPAEAVLGVTVIKAEEKDPAEGETDPKENDKPQGEGETDPGEDDKPKDGDAGQVRVPLPSEGAAYAASEDNFAPVVSSGKINDLVLDFSKVKESGVDPSGLKMTAIGGSKFSTKEKLKDRKSYSVTGGVKVKVGKDLIPDISCKSDGTATLTMEDDSVYTIAFKVEKPKAQKSAKSIGVGGEPVTRSVKDLFGTDIDSGELTVLKQKHSLATVSDNKLYIDPKEKDTIKLQYKYLNKKYKLTIKVK